MRLRYFQATFMMYHVVQAYVKCHSFKMAAKDVVMEELDSPTQWLVERARQSLKENNPYEAKAWLITARTLYPKDFGVQVSFEY